MAIFCGNSAMAVSENVTGVLKGCPPTIKGSRLEFHLLEVLFFENFQAPKTIGA